MNLEIQPSQSTQNKYDFQTVLSTDLTINNRIRKAIVNHYTM